MERALVGGRTAGKDEKLLTRVMSRFSASAICYLFIYLFTVSYKQQPLVSSCFWLSYFINIHLSGQCVEVLQHGQMCLLGMIKMDIDSFEDGLEK